MRIGIDASLASLAGSGTGRYAAGLIRHLVALDQENEYVLYFRSRDRQENPLFALRGPRLEARVTDAPLSLLRIHLNLPLRLSADRVDCYHSLGFFLPWLWRGKTVVNIHDIHPLLLKDHWWRPGTRAGYFVMRVHIPLAVRQARWILAPSEYVRRTICERFRVPPERIAVTPPGVDPFFLAEPGADDVRAARQRVGAGRFFLYVGVIAPQKNLSGLVRAFARLRARAPADDTRLVLVGNPVGRYAELELGPLIRELGLSHVVVATGYVDDRCLRALYRSAIALVLPSFGEGFGLPLLEAMACGTPIVTSAVSALPEVAGNAALYANPHDPGEIAAAMQRLSDDDALRRELRAKGLARVSSFTWEKTVPEILRVYRDG